MTMPGLAAACSVRPIVQRAVAQLPWFTRPRWSPRAPRCRSGICAARCRTILASPLCRPNEQQWSTCPNGAEMSQHPPCATAPGIRSVVDQTGDVSRGHGKLEWPMVEFGEVYAEASRNGIYKSREHHGMGVKIVNMGELFAHDIINRQEMKRVHMTDAEMRTSSLADGDLLFGRRSLVESGAGKCSLVEGLTEPTTFESSIIRVRVNQSSIRARFVFYWLKSHQGLGRVRSIVTGTNVKGIRGSVLKKVEVPCPPLSVQDAIVSTLCAYDDLIENNRQRIRLLERAARTSYEEWFVHLRFPGNEYVTITDGVPDEWETKFASDVISINPRHPGPDGTLIRYVPMSALSTSGMVVDLSMSEIRTESTPVRFMNGDTLLARITPCLENGKTGYVNFLNQREIGCGSTEFIVLRGRGISPYFTYCLAPTVWHARPPFEVPPSRA